jgi:hypothetical protein
MVGMLTKMKFSRKKSNFQIQLGKDVEKIRETKELIIQADKTSNHYLMAPEKYLKLLKENITKDYKLANPKQLSDVNKETAEIARKLEIDDRVDSFSRNPPFITLKDHKESWPNKVGCRLVNPAKPIIGRVSKIILEKINKEVRNKLGLEQWTSTNNVLAWFNKLEDKSNLRFIKYDIESFYPNISEKLFEMALEFASKTTKISQENKELFKNTHKAFIVDHEGKSWVKKGTSSFDTTMGSLDGAETAELTGLYLLNEINKLIPQAGLYRDDGLGVAKLSGPQWAKREEITPTFQAKWAQHYGGSQSDFH